MCHGKILPELHETIRPNHGRLAGDWRQAMLHFMKMQTTSIVTAASILLAGCSKQSGSSGTASSSAPEPGNAESAAVPVAKPAMTAWQQGDKSAAVSGFLAADWSAHPLFASDSALSLSENQLDALPLAELQAKSGEVVSQLDSLKGLARAVIQAGDDAVAKGDTTQARKCFTAVQQCGEALDSTNCLRLAQFVGQALKKRAQSELAKIGP
jgi:hypothetical protein